MISYELIHLVYLSLWCLLDRVHPLFQLFIHTIDQSNFIPPNFHSNLEVSWDQYFIMFKRHPMFVRVVSFFLEVL